MKSLSFICVSLILLSIPFSCQKAPKLTTADIKNVTQEHQMTYVWSLNAVLNAENGVDNFIFGGEEKNAAAISDYKKALKDWWDINSKYDLTQSIQNLIGGRMHNPAFVEEYEGFFDISEAQFQKNLKENPEYNDLDLILWKNKALFKSKGILAWDIIRASALIGWGYHAEYLSKEEAYDLSLALGTAVQKHFTSFAELYENYLAGYLYWSGDTAAYKEREATVKALLDDPESPWNVFPFDYDMTKK